MYDNRVERIRTVWSSKTWFRNQHNVGKFTELVNLDFVRSLNCNMSGLQQTDPGVPILNTRLKSTQMSLVRTRKFVHHIKQHRNSA